LKITTLRTLAGTPGCSDFPTCPGVHDLDTDPEHRYVIAKTITDPTELAAFAGELGDGEVPGWMPAGFLPAGNEVFTRTRRLWQSGMRSDRDYVITTLVTDAAVLQEFAPLMAADEHLGTVPVRALLEV
jgi:hypothetical protein